MSQSFPIQHDSYQGVMMLAQQYGRAQIGYDLGTLERSVELTAKLIIGEVVEVLSVKEHSIKASQ